MDLEKLNKNYERAKKELEGKKKHIEKLEKELQNVMEDIVIAKGEKIIAERENDDDEVKAAEQKIKEKEAEIKKIKEKAEEEKEDMQIFQEKIDRVVEEIKENPEMKQHLEQVLVKRYVRDNKKINKEVEEIEKKKEEEAKKIENVEAVQDMIEKHPTMQNHMQGMLNANATIQKLKNELATLDMIKDKARIDTIKKEMKAANTKLASNRDAIVAFSDRNKLGIKKETLESIMKYAVIDKKTGKVNVKASLSNTKKSIENEIKQYDKKIVGYNKQICNNETALMNLGYRIEEKDAERVAEEMGNAQPQSSNETEVEQNKPKWFQFVKKFKQWRENKKVSKLPKAEQKSAENAQKNEETNEFSQSLKYQVVKDIAKQMQQEKLKEVKQQQKSQNGMEK